MSETIDRRINELEANALGCLRKGLPVHAADYLTRAIGYVAAQGGLVSRLDKALAECVSDPRQAICTLDGHDHEGGPTCYHCGARR